MIRNDFQDYSIDLPHRILVVNRGSLLDEGVASLISSRSNLDVSTINFESEEVLVNDIISKHPEVVVMGQSGSVKFEKLYKLLTNIPNLAKLRLIVFHTNDNSVDVFSKGHLIFVRGDDFIELVQGA
jgi:hypothetical protein